MWVEIIYLTIARRNQMDRLASIDEDKWPELSELEDYQPRFPADKNYYNPRDYFFELELWLRDYSIKERKMRVVSRQQQEEKEPISQWS